MTPDYTAAEHFISGKLQSELPANLTYHGFHHVIDVLNSALAIAESEHIRGDDLKLLRVAVFFHDAGFLYTYKGHEEKGCEIARQYLPQFGFDEEQINIICGMIMATRLPQVPLTKPEQIIADADLDYLGREDFYRIGRTLYEEFRIYLNVQDEMEWNRIQLNFLRSHHYHTSYSIQHREPMKQKRLHEIEKTILV